MDSGILLVRIKRLAETDPVTFAHRHAGFQPNGIVAQQSNGGNSFGRVYDRLRPSCERYVQASFYFYAQHESGERCLVCTRLRSDLVKR